MPKIYTTHLRHCSVAEAADALRRAGLTGLALRANPHWCTVVLERSTDERGRLATLAAQNPDGVLLYDVGGVGERIWSHVGDALHILRPDTVADWVRLGLLTEDRGGDWSSQLALPEPVEVTDQLLRQPFVGVMGAVAVGLDIEVPMPAPRPMMPSSPSQLFAMLKSTGAVALKPGANAITAEFSERVGGGEAAVDVLSWLVEHPDVEEVFVSDAAFDLILTSMRARYS